MHISKTLALAGAALVFAANAQAADHMKTGEWEVSVKIGMKGGPQIPPDQLAMMKKMGIPNPFGGEPIVSTQCVTAEMASLDKPFKNEHHDGNQCEIENYKHTGNKATAEMVCTGDLKGRGDFTMTLDSETAYHGGWTVKGISKQAGPVEQAVEMHGKWLKAECDAK